MASSPVVVERTIACRSKAPALWCVISDTERLNRAIGLEALELRDNDDDSAARYLVSTTAAGLPLEYEERPFEWVENELFSVRREVRKGVATFLEHRFELTPRKRGVDVTVRVTVGPRMRVLKPVILVQTRRVVDRLVKEILEADQQISEGREALLGSQEPRLDRAALDEVAGALRQAAKQRGSQRAVERVVAHVRDAPDYALSRMRPLELADAWDLDGRMVLETCLSAVVNGLLELYWDIICPSCMTAADRVQTLDAIGESGHCQLCEIRFDLALDTSVEATFRPSPRIRTIDDGPYCIGGPMRTPHVFSQCILPPDGDAELKVPESLGRYRLFIRGGSTAVVDVKQGSPESVSIGVEDELAAVSVGPSGKLRLTQRGKRERHAKLERRDWDQKAATALMVSTMSGFRRQFSSQVLRTGASLRIGCVALLFTDLTASTHLYRSVGDAEAFRYVHDHFDLIEEVVDEHHGTVIKTMGDAVMAAFVDERDALAAAVAIQRRFPAFREQHRCDVSCAVRVGVYVGPCYAVRANGVLDYFGQTVNVAARLQAEARGGELVVTDELHAAHATLLPADHCEHFEADLKGVGRVRCCRIALDRGDETA